VHRRVNRYAIDLPVELLAPGVRERVAMQDVSPSGMFLAVAAPLPIGAQLAVALEHRGERVVCAARVTHCLAAPDARVLGRSPGVGIELLHPSDRFATALDRVLQRASSAPPDRIHVVIGDREPRLLERLSTTLGSAGFAVTTAQTGPEVLAACARKAPHVVIVDRALPVIDGFSVRERLACEPRLSAVPLIVMSEEPGDLALAFERGAADFLAKPFTIPELAARARRVAHRDEPVVLAGNLSQLGLAAVLTMLELERKTGRLVISDGHAAWIDVVDGRVVDAGWSRGEGDVRSIVLELLGVQHGTFRLTTRAVHRDSGVALPITHLLLEWARLHDESSRPHRAHTQPPVDEEPPQQSVA